MQDEKPPEGADEEPKGKNVALQAALDAKGLADSNIYSVAEMILLRWVNYHYTKQVQASRGSILSGSFRVSMPTSRTGSSSRC